MGGSNMAPSKTDLISLESLREQLNHLAEDLTTASNEQETREIAKRLEIIQQSVPDSETSEADRSALMKEIAQKISVIEERLKQIHDRMQRKRRMQEGEVIENIKSEQNRYGVEVLPLITKGAPLSQIRKRTKEADLDEKIIMEPQLQDSPVKENEKMLEWNTPEPKKEDENHRSFRRIVASLAETYGKNPQFLSKLGGVLEQEPEIADAQTAEAHHRTVLNLRRRLVNLELHLKLIVEAAKTQQPLYSLIRGAARDVKEFHKELSAAKEARPNLADTYERLFGGYDKAFMDASNQLGQQIWNRYRDEKADRERHKSQGRWKEYIASCTGKNVEKGNEALQLARAMSAKHLEQTGCAYDPALAERNAVKLMETQAFQTMSADQAFVKDCLANNKVGQAISALMQERKAPQIEDVRQESDPISAQADADVPVLVRRPEENQD